MRWSPAADTHHPAAVTATEDPGSAPASLISDLDAHYRVLLDHMDKYEWLLTSRPPRPATPDQPSSLSLLEELQLSAAVPPPPTSLRAAPLRDSGPASLMLLGAASDGDASSSGFSDGSEGSRAVSRATQTPELMQTPPPPTDDGDVKGGSNGNGIGITTAEEGDGGVQAHATVQTVVPGDLPGPEEAGRGVACAAFNAGAFNISSCGFNPRVCVLGS